MDTLLHKVLFSCLENAHERVRNAGNPVCAHFIIRKVIHIAIVDVGVVVAPGEFLVPGVDQQLGRDCIAEETQQPDEISIKSHFAGLDRLSSCTPVLQDVGRAPDAPTWQLQPDLPWAEKLRKILALIVIGCL